MVLTDAGHTDYLEMIEKCREMYHTDTHACAHMHTQTEYLAKY